MNVVILTGTVHAEPTISYTKNGKPHTTFELVVRNEDNPQFYTKEAVLIVGNQAEPLCERLEAGDEVEITGKLQRGQVVCFKVHMRDPALTSGREATRAPRDEDDRDAEPPALNLEAPSALPAKKPRKRPYPKAALEHGGFVTNPN